MNTLLVYPRFPLTYWGFQYGLHLVDKQASLPPLGLIQQLREHLIRFAREHLVPLMEQAIEKARSEPDPAPVGPRAFVPTIAAAPRPMASGLLPGAIIEDTYHPEARAD